MNALEEITLKKLSEMINYNQSLAMVLDATMSWRFKNGIIHASLSRSGVVVFEQFYAGKYVHIHIAEMHRDFKRILDVMPPSSQSSGGSDRF